MFYLREILDKDFLISVQKILVQSSKTFVSIYERDGSLLSFEVHPSFICSCLKKDEINSSCNQSLCCCQMPKLPVKAQEKACTIRLRCSCGLDIFVIPIKYKRSIIGYMSIGVPRSSLYSNSTPARVDALKAGVSSPTVKKLSLEFRNMLKNQLKEANKMISNVYADRIKCQIGKSFLTCNDLNSLCRTVITEAATCVTLFKKVGKDLKINYANKHSLEYYGVNSLEEIMNKSIRELMPRSEDIYALHFKAIETGETIKINEFMYKNPQTNQPSWWNVSITPCYKKGKIIGSISIRNEITEHVLARKNFQQLLNKFQEKSSQLEAVIDNMSEGLILCDKNGSYLIWNKAAFKLLNVPHMVEKIGQTREFFTLKELNGDIIPIEQYPINKVFRGQLIVDQLAVVQIKNETQDKKVFLFNGKPMYDKNNNFVFGLITFSDITRLQEQSIFIEEQWNLIDRALDQLEAPTYILTYPDLKFVLSNKQANYFFSSILKRNINKNNISNENVKIISDILKIVDIEKYYLDLGANKKIPNSVPTITLNIDGQTRYFTAISTPIQNSSGETTHIICSAFEITSSIVYSRKLAEVSRLKEEFFANVSHEFRTPLTVILGALQVLSTTEHVVNLDEHRLKTAKYLAIMKQNCNRLVKLINNLLDVTRIDSGYLLLYLQKHDIVSLVREITMSVSDYFLQKKLSLRFSSNVTSKEMPVDIDKMERILLNLLSNAVKFTPEGNKIFVSLKDKGEHIEIRVRDTGVGIPPEKLEIIFERFRQVDNVLTRKNEGSGLGLTLVKSLVELHGGTIKAKSKPGKGTEFIICLPVNFSNDFIQKPVNPHYDRAISEVINIEFSDLNLI
ncbi:MAG: ATP-binding protein [Deltaproteobacteria bacterium]